jgi:hypothetical protein
MSGVRLEELSMSDMVDVLHYMFEENTSSMQTGEQLEAREKMRGLLYSTMYGREYRYAMEQSSQSRGLDNLDPPLGDDDDMGDAPMPVDPFQKSNVPKPYFPPTDLNPGASLPFGRALDAPLG